ncbi:non-specific lipid-transfer protein C, cotyledon-specific isoform-like [Solanum verrucosum]|uniref:non-specific lipid-transfer protein C, cotyledon-specific isoform-like n=1 Tax=Solanum verrucosum TaxID=315347 RepID=UPI0020D132DF|nr:non-specific lipid-transfer protein C, cotyledon-specific isoform-like [Solanum verrucosum]
MAKILLTLFSLALILGQTNAVIQCGTDVIPKVISCGGFILGDDAKPSQACCVGLQDLAKIASASQPDRKDICLCFKAAMQGSKVNYTKAKQLPDLCHFTPFMPMVPNPDCSKVI